MPKSMMIRRLVNDCEGCVDIDTTLIKNPIQACPLNFFACYTSKKLKSPLKSQETISSGTLLN